MCTGAEIPALLGATAAGTAATAGTAAGAGAAGAGLGAGLGAAGAMDMMGSLGTGLAGSEGLLGAGGAMDMMGSAGTGLAGSEGLMGLGAGTGASAYPDAMSGELASVGTTHSPAYYEMGGNAFGGQNTGAVNLWDKLTAKADPKRMGMNLLNQSLQPQTPRPGAQAQRPQQQPMAASPQFAGTQPMGQPMTPGTAGSMLTRGVQPTAGAADILRRMGLLGGMNNV